MLRVARQHDSIAIEADAHHLLTDVWTSAGVIAGLLVMMALPELAWLDAAVAIAVAIHIVFTGVHLLRRSADGLMDAALPDDELRSVEDVIRTNLPAEASYHALRTRKAGARRFIEFHLLVPGSVTVAASHVLCDRLETAIAARLAQTAITIHVEPLESQAAHP
jgi:cation diffusion facilitator family transporter